MIQADSLAVQSIYEHLPIGQTLDTCNGFFQHNSMLHPELPRYVMGISAERLPFQLWRQDWVVGLLLVILLVGICTFLISRQQLKAQIHDFFFTRACLNSDKSELGEYVWHKRFLYCVLYAVVGAFAFLILLLIHHMPESFVLPVYALLALYAVCIFAYLIIRHFGYYLINMVFFTDRQQRCWRDADIFLRGIEILLLYVFVIVWVFFFPSIPELRWLPLFSVLFFRLLASYKACSIFFPRFYLIVHLFAYLCTLEIVPLLALCKVLVQITDNLILKY